MLSEVVVVIDLETAGDFEDADLGQGAVLVTNIESGFEGVAATEDDRRSTTVVNAKDDKAAGGRSAKRMTESEEGLTHDSNLAQRAR
jgi:hypothetical protein